MRGKKKRVFVGIPTSKKLQKEAKKWSLHFARTLPARWIPPGNLHITLIPPWSVNEQDLEAVKKVFKQLKYKSFKIVFSHISFGPRTKKPRLIWAVANNVKEVEILKKTLEQILGRSPQERNLKIHLTLARFHSRKFQRSLPKNWHKKIYWKESVNSICLFESRSSSQGVNYKPLEMVKFRKQT